MTRASSGRTVRTSTLFLALALAVALLAAVPSSASGDAATDRVDLMRAAVASGEAPSVAYSFQTEHEEDEGDESTRRCWSDEVGDTHVFPAGEGDATESDEPRADIVEFCGHYGPTLALTVQTAEPTNPEGDAGWQGATFIGWFVDTDGDGQGDYFVDYSLDRTGVLTATIERIEEDNPNPETCAAPGIKAAYTSNPHPDTPALFSVSGIGQECFDGATDIDISVAVFYDESPGEDGGVHFDSAPGGDAFADVPEGGDPRFAGRLAGRERIRTSIAISQHQFRRSARTVYLARAYEPPGGDASPDAVAGGVLNDGPIILVPPEGTAPDFVIAEINRLNPERVVALGGDNAIAPSVLASAAGQRQTGRLAGPTRIGTSAEISRHRFANAAEATEVYLARAYGTLADAVVGGTLTRGPILLVQTDGAIDPAVRAEIDRLDPERVVALGGEGAIRETVLAEAAGDRETRRLAGQGRIQTAIAISEYQFPGTAEELYLARADVFADAVAGGILTRGPILLVPNDVGDDDTLTAEQRWNSTFAAIPNEISRVAPLRVYALGGTGAVSDRVLQLSANS